MENTGKDQKGNYQRMVKISNSLTAADIKEDVEQLFSLIRKHHPDGRFRILEDVNFIPSTGNPRDTVAAIRPSMAVIEFAIYLNEKYKDEDLRTAVSNKIFRDYLMKR